MKMAVAAREIVTTENKAEEAIGSKSSLYGEDACEIEGNSHYNGC